MYPITELLKGGTLLTTKSGVTLEQIDRVEFDAWGKLRIRGYVSYYSASGSRLQPRWTILDPSDIDLNA
jgi:hypothetical protein